MKVPEISCRLAFNGLKSSTFIMRIFNDHIDGLPFAGEGLVVRPLGLEIFPSLDRLFFGLFGKVWHGGADWCFDHLVVVFIIRHIGRFFRTRLFCFSTGGLGWWLLSRCCRRYIVCSAIIIVGGCPHVDHGCRGGNGINDSSGWGPDDNITGSRRSIINTAPIVIGGPRNNDGSRVTGSRAQVDA